MDRLTTRIDGYAYGKRGIKRLSKGYHRGSFECTALIERLAEYEDLEEQGLLIRLPCKVGDTVYIIDHRKIIKGKVNGYNWWPSCGFCLNVVWSSPIMEYHNLRMHGIEFKTIGKQVFLTYEEAEKKLKKMES